MVQYKNILIPVDGSEASIKAFKQAVHIAERNDAALDIRQPKLPLVT